MAWFTGTSNAGKTYEVGKQYVSAGDVYTANANGTFTNERSGRTNVGSSQSPTALFGGYQSLSSPLPGLWSKDPDWRGSGGSGPGNGSTQSGPGYAGSGPGAYGVAGAPQSSGPGNGVVHRKSSGSSLVLETRLDPATRIVGNGREWNIDHSWSDGGVGEQRWGEWGGALYGLAVMGNDALYGMGVNTKKVWDDVHHATTPTTWAPALADGIEGFGAFLGERRDAFNTPEAKWARERAEAVDPWFRNSPIRQYNVDGQVVEYSTGGGF